MKIILGVSFLLFLFLYPTPYTLYPTYAQSCTGSISRAEGLISTPQRSATSKFGSSSGACIIDPKAVFTPYKVPTYDDLKSLYYTQAKPPVRKDQIAGSPSQGDFTSKFTQNDIVLVNGDLPDLNYTGTTKPSVVFVEGNLTIGSNITYGDANSGLVFVVKGNVNISQTITRIDAIIIAEGTICTAFDGALCPGTNVTTSQLVINGSLISLNEATPIKFRRALTDNTQAAEKINHQVKYLVILRNLMSDTFQRWSEVTADTPIPPAPTPIPTPTPPAYSRVFVTSQTFTGNLGGVAGADAKCQAAATSPTANLGGNWKAWINGQYSSLPSALSFVLIDRSTVVANNRADLLSGTIRNEINLNENGQIKNTPVWTNTLSNGNIKYTNSINYCNNFTATGTAGSLGGVRGLSSTKDGGWTDSDYVGCERSAALYCFEQP